MDGEYFDEEGNASTTPGRDFIDEDGFRLAKLLGIRIPKSLFKPGGFRCSYCGFRTKKLGSAGRNSLRAHYKKHLNDARAGRHLRSAAWLGVLLMLCAPAFVIYSKFGAGAVEFWVGDLVREESVGPALAGASLASSTAMITSAYLYTRRHRKRWRIVFNTSLIPAFAVLLAQVALVSGVTQLDVAWYWLFSGFLPLFALTVTRKSVGLTALDVSRRDIKPRHYIRVFKAKTADGDSLLDDIYVEIRLMIRKGQINPQNLEWWQQQALVTLGVLKFQDQE